MEIQRYIYRFVYKVNVAAFLFIVVNMPVFAQKTTSNLVLEDETIDQGTHVFTNCGDIISPGSEDKPFVVTGDAQVIFSSGTAIHLRPGFRASDFSTNGYFRTATMNTEILEPGDDVGKFEKLELGIILPAAIESQIELFLNSGYKQGVNHYDPDFTNSNGISVEALFTSPTGDEHLIYGFYYRDYVIEQGANPDWKEVPTKHHWRVRFAPDELGTWTCAIKVYSSKGIPYIEQTCDVSFNCIESENKGYLEVGNYNYLRFSDTHESFFAVGENIAWPNEWGEAIDENGPWIPWSSVADYNKQFQYLNELAQHDGNYVRFVLAPWGPLVEWEHLGVYDAYTEYDYWDNTKPRNRQMHLWMLDSAFEFAHDNNMYIHLCGDLHGGYMKALMGANGVFYEPISWNEMRTTWSSNPYNNIDLYPLNPDPTPVDFFESDLAKKYYKNRLRYTAARWGYSTNLAVYEIFSEIDMINKGEIEEYDHCYWNGIIQDITAAWHVGMAEYLKLENDPDEPDETKRGLGFKQMLSTCFAGYQPNVFAKFYNNENMDITSSHTYGNTRIVNFEHRYNAITWLKDDYNKPAIIGEMGDVVEIEGCTDICLHNSLWATAFMGSYGTGLTFWWNVHHKQSDPEQLEKYLSNYSNLNNFIKDIDFENNTYIANRYSENNTDELAKEDMLEVIYLTSYFPVPIITGWIHNASYYWYNNKEELLLTSCNSNGDFTNIVANVDGNFIDADDDNEYPVELLNGSIDFDDLWPETYYSVQFYDTRTGQFDVTEDQIVYTDDLGKVTIIAPVLDDEHPDYAFLMTELIHIKSIFSDNESMSKKGDITTKGNFVLSPNPSSTGIFYLLSKYEENFDLTVYDLKGSVILNSTAEIGVTEINLSEFTRGLYYLKLTNWQQTQTFNVIRN